MKKCFILIVAIFVLIFTSCMTTREMRNTVEVKDDGFSPAITVVGIEEPISEDYANTIFVPNYFFIRSFVDRAGDMPIMHQIYIIRHYNYDWHFYNRAAAQGGAELEFVSIDRDVDCGQYGCTYTEQMGVSIPDEMLKQNPDGFPIKVFSKSGKTFIVNISANQISSQFRAIEGL